MKITTSDTSTKKKRTGSGKETGHIAENSMDHDKTPEIIQPDPSNATPAIPQEIPPRDYSI